MKRSFWLVVCFCLMAVFAQAGAGGKSAKQDNPRQAGKSSIHFYDIESTDNHGYGRLVIDTEKKTFTFIGQDYPIGGEIQLQHKSESGLFSIMAKGRSTPSGNIHISGEWEGNLPIHVVTTTYYPHVPANGFSVENDGGFVIQVGCHYAIYDYYSEPTWIECPNKSHNMALGDSKYAHFKDLGVPLGASVKIKIYVALGPDQTHFETFTYAYGDYDPGYCYGNYTIEGTVFNPLLQYWSTQCESTPGQGDWEVIDLP